MKRWRQRLGWCGYQPKNTKAASKVLAWNSRIYYFKLLELKSWCGQGGSRENCFLAFFNFLWPSAFLGSSKMYGKNHYNTVISLQLIKIKKKKKELQTNKTSKKQNKTKQLGGGPGEGSPSFIFTAGAGFLPLHPSDKGPSGYPGCCCLLPSCVGLFATPCLAACQAPLSFTIFWSLLRFISIELVMLSNHLILCHPILLFPPICPSMRIFSSESALCIR